jgi:RimJ/RimL family protein N-acetyltransferase
MNWATPVTLSGEHATLVPLTIEHLEDLTTAIQDGELWNLWYTKVPKPEDMDTEIKRRLRLQDLGEMLPFVIIAQDQVVGMTTYMNIDAKCKRLEIGYTWYSKSVQKTAVNTECKLLLLTHAFEALGAVAVAFNTSSFNHASRTAIERLGAKLDGVLRNHRILPNGLIGDTYAYSIIDREWPIVKCNLNYKLQR